MRKVGILLQSVHTTGHGSLHPVRGPPTGGERSLRKHPSGSRHSSQRSCQGRPPHSSSLLSAGSTVVQPVCCKAEDSQGTGQDSLCLLLHTQEPRPHRTSIRQFRVQMKKKRGSEAAKVLLYVEINMYIYFWPHPCRHPVLRPGTEPMPCSGSTET